MVAKTVLVVEDDPCIRIVAEEMFAAAGIEVESVQRADHALAIVAQRSEQTALLFTDVQTPGPIDGIDLARLVKTHWPHVEVLVTSGRPVCDLLQSRGRARRFLSWQEQPSPNSNYTDTLVNDIRGLRLEKDAWSGFCPTPSFRPSGRPRKPAWRLWPGRQAFGFDRRATKRSFWDDLAGNRPLVEDLDVAGRRARRIIASIPLNEQALDVRRGLCPAFETGVSKTPVISLAEAGVARSRRKTQHSARGFKVR